MSPVASVRGVVWAWGLLGLLCCVCLTRAAQAERSFIDPNARGLLPSYRVHLSTRLTAVDRADFERAVFLFQQPLERIVSREIRSELALELQLFPSLYLGFSVPYSVRQADAKLAAIVISERQILGGRWIDLESQGVADPSVQLVWRASPALPFSAELGLGVVIPRDDNPGSNSVPTRLPLGTGQTEVFLEPMLGLSAANLRLAALYHFGFHPGNTATYLVREVGPQSYASGALAPYLTHRLGVSLQWSFWPRFRLGVAPELSVDDNPLVVARGVRIRFIEEVARFDVGMDACLCIDAHPGHTLELHYKHWFLHSWQQDPFFPIQLPDQGLTLAWKVSKF